MFVFALDFDREGDADAAIERLRRQYQVTGEFHVRPLEGGGWRLTVYSERALRDSVIERLGGRRVDARG